jgi:hypothetical protein
MSEKFQELSGDEITKKELDSVVHKLMDDATSGIYARIKSGVYDTLRMGVAVTERIDDNCAAFFGSFLGPDARANHSNDLEKLATQAINDKDVDRASHYLKRDICYTSWTQGYDSSYNQRLQFELEQLQKKN